MNEYTIHIDSHEGLATDEGLTAIAQAMACHPGCSHARDAALGIDEHHAYSATFQVTATSLGAAARSAELAFTAALQSAGLDAAAIAHLDVLAPAVAAAA